MISQIESFLCPDKQEGKLEDTAAETLWKKNNKGEDDSPKTLNDKNK